MLETTLTKEQFIEWAKGQGYRPGPFGHLQIEFKGVPFRFRLKAAIVISERKSEFGWRRLRSGYFSSMSIVPDGRITGLKQERF